MPTEKTPQQKNTADATSPSSNTSSSSPKTAQKGSPGAKPFSVPSISLPKGGGAIRGIGEKFGVNAATGTGSLSVPLASSPGRSGFGPQLSLSYNSGSGNSPFGFGWSIGLPEITRKTDKGLPRYDDDGESDVFIISGAEDLVPVLDENAEPVRMQRTVHGVLYHISIYRPRIEGLFARIERWKADTSGISHWRTITRDNVTTLYGYDPESRIADPDDPRKIFSWLICRSFDDKGNMMRYRYAAENSDGVTTSRAHETNRTTASRAAGRYLKRVLYGNAEPWFADWSAGGAEPTLPSTWHFELVVDYGDHAPVSPTPAADRPWPVRPDPFSTYRSGFEVRTYRRCKRVLMFHHFPDEPGVGANCLVRSSDLLYSDEISPADPANPIYTFLHSVTQTGYRRDGDGYRARSMPPVEFDYSKPAVQPDVLSLGRESFANLPEGIDGSRYQWVDLDGEGLSGILADFGGGWGYKRNLSPLNRTTDPHGRTVTRARFGPMETVRRIPSHSNLSGGVRLMDVDGDGQIDVVSLDPPLPGFFERTVDEDWKPFKQFASLPQINWSDPNLRFIDLTGDGLADALITEDGVFTFYPSLGEKGFDQPERVATGWDEERGPKIVMADGTQTVFIADMSGDGLADIVRVRNGEICYWPNLGYGRFGARVSMDRAPRFTDQERFDPARIRLADIDGSGSTDVLYIGEDGVHVCFNHSGNSWAAPTRIAVFPTADPLSAVQVFDLLGNGTACLVWSSSLPAHASAPLLYVDLMGGVKPHLMIASRNNLGAETRVRYAPSTQFYLADKMAGKPWITKLPNLVHVVERMEVYDFIGRSRFVTRYAYHHGYFDGIDREFRGFGMVEQWDTEEHRDDTDFPDAPTVNWDAASWVPPLHTKTWFHTGAFIEAGPVSQQYMQEYWTEPAARGGSPAARAAREALLLPDTILPDDLSPEEMREAYRALKGSALRIEVYAEDGTARAEHPYTVTEQNFTVRHLQPHGPNRHTVFLVHPHEALQYHYERQPDDPRILHTITLETDSFGNTLRSVAMGYPRRAGYADPEPDLSTTFRSMLAHDQSRIHITGTEQIFTGTVNTPWSETPFDAYRSPLLCQTMTAELTGLSPGDTRFQFDEIDGHWSTLWSGSYDIPYEEVSTPDIEGTGTPTGMGRRIVEHTCTLYRRNDMSGLLPLGTAESQALPGESYQLAFTPELVTRIFGSRVNNALLSEGGYVQLSGGSKWWIPSGRIAFSSGMADTPAQERTEARAHFYQPRRSVDPFGGVSQVEHDRYDLLLRKSMDAVGNITTADNNYRMLSPYRTIDPNGNYSEVTFDCLGIVAGTAVYGKMGEGDSLAGFDPDLTEQAILDLRDDPLHDPDALLAGATTRIVTDPLAFYRTRNSPEPDAPMVYVLTRETHLSDLPSGATPRLHHLFNYFDGFGQEAQKKESAEPGPLVEGGTTASPRWAGSGWNIYNNKGKVIRSYEPFFSDTHRFEFDHQIGVSAILFYDAAERLVAMLHPDHTFEKTLFNGWRQEIWDRNDTVLIGDPRTDPDVGEFFRRLFGTAPGAFVSWHDLRIGGTFGASPAERLANREAALKTEAHAATPAVTHLDSLARTCLAIADNGISGGSARRYATRTALDAENKPLAVIDPLERRVVEFVLREPAAGGGFTYVAGYDITGRELYHNSMDAGERRTLPDIFGKTIRIWNVRGFTFRLLYDALRRLTHRYVAENGLGETLAERIVYGDRHPDESLNLKGKIFRHYDSSGVASSEAYDFKGNLLRSGRQLALHTPSAQSPAELDREPDWSPIATINDTPTLDIAALDAAADPLLDPADAFIASSKFDALNRPVQIVTPHLLGGRPSVIQPIYNQARRLEAVDVWIRQGSSPPLLLDPTTADIPAVTGIAYSARGERTEVVLGNGSITRYSYDPETFRIATIATTRSHPNPDARLVQALSYTYDPVGNIIRLRDDADIHNVVYFRNQRVDPSADYSYDPLYRLIQASGREHLGLTGGSLNGAQQPDNDDGFRMRIPSPGDGKAMGNYTEDYSYDPVGNILEMVHQVASGGWTRRYSYQEPSLIAASETNNRLSATSVPGDSPAGPYTARYRYDEHGNMTRMPHLPEMTWDTYDRLQSTARQVMGTGTPETTYYTYDAGGQRLRKITYRQHSGSGAPARKCQRIYLGPFEIYREYDAAGTTVVRERETLHVMLDERRVLMVETRTIDLLNNDPAPAQMIRYQYSNNIGSAALELDESAEVLSYEEYFPYGATSYQAVRNATDTPKRYRYTGKERDEENDLSYHGARYYVPWLGRWTAADPGGLVDGVNLYRYARNNPIILHDPSGRQADEGTTNARKYQDRSIQLNTTFDQLQGAMEVTLAIELKDPSTGNSFRYSSNNKNEILQSLLENSGFAAALSDAEREGLLSGIKDAVKNAMALADNMTNSGSAGAGSLTTYDAAQRTKYLRLIKDKSMEGVNRVIIAREANDLAAAETAAKEASDYRNATRTATQKKLSPSGRMLSEALEQDRSWPKVLADNTTKALEKKPNGNMFDVYERIASKSGESSKAVTKLAKVSRVLGPIGIAIGVVAGAHAIYSASPEERPKVAAEETGSFIGGMVGSAAGTAVAAAFIASNPVGWAIGLAIVGGIIGSWIGGKIGGSVYESIQNNRSDVNPEYENYRFNSADPKF